MYSVHVRARDAGAADLDCEHFGHERGRTAALLGVALHQYK